MGVDASWPLKAAVLDNLRNNARIREVLGDNGGVTDMGDSDSVMAAPVIAVSGLKTQVWHSATFDGQDHELILDIRAPDEGALQAICTAVTSSLHGADFPVRGHALIEMSFESSRTRQSSDGGSGRCEMFFRALTVSD